MAALPETHPDPPPQIALIDLRDLQPEHLTALLEEETEAWRTGLDWDFRASAELVRKFLQGRALSGFALYDASSRGAGIIGYSYYVVEEGKGLIGDFYVRAAARNIENENRLMEAALEAMWRATGVRRVEAQLLMLSSHAGREAPFPRWFTMFPRRFLQAPLAAGAFPARQTPRVVYKPWLPPMSDEAARLIAIAYRDHVDSEINDQYRSVTGASRFLVNIVQYPGCGLFFPPASFAARDESSGALIGISLASLVSAQVGHITQLCVAPSHRGRQVGYELMRRSMEALAAHGCRSVTLTVTSSNAAAIRLYESMGFRTRLDFAAYVWEIG